MLKILSFKVLSFNQLAIRSQNFFTTKVRQVPRQFMEPIHTKFEIIDKEKINYDCYIYRFKFNGPKFPLKIGQHFRIMANVPTADFPKGQEIMRYYTPITSCKDFQKDKIEVLIKIYRPNEDSLYPKGGILTPHLQKLSIGDNLNIEGPFGKFTYESPGQVEISKNIYSKIKNVYNIKKLFFIAGGTGITPIYQTMTEIARIPDDKTEMKLLFCNKTQNDIILREQLEALQPRLKLHLMVEHMSPEWNGLHGRPSLPVLNQIHPLNDSQTFYLYCGPPAMNLALTKMFEQYHPTAHYHKI